MRHLVRCPDWLLRYLSARRGSLTSNSWSSWMRKSYVSFSDPASGQMWIWSIKQFDCWVALKAEDVTRFGSINCFHFLKLVHYLIFSAQLRMKYWCMRYANHCFLLYLQITQWPNFLLELRLYQNTLTLILIFLKLRHKHYYIHVHYNLQPFGLRDFSPRNSHAFKMYTNQLNQHFTRANVDMWSIWDTVFVAEVCGQTCYLLDSKKEICLRLFRSEALDTSWKARCNPLWNIKM